MFELPINTEFNKRISKQKFYEYMGITSTIRKLFTNQIKAIFWQNKLAATTLNVAPGQQVTEIEVLEVCLYSSLLDEAVLRQIDRVIPYHIIFILEYDEKFQAWIGHKESSETGKNAFKVNRYYHTEWMTEDELSFQIDGLNMDIIYENIFRKIAGGIFKEDSSKSLRDTVQRDEQIQLLKKQIAILQTKIRNEKQLNRQVEMNTELKKLKRELEGLK